MLESLRLVLPVQSRWREYETLHDHLASVADHITDGKIPPTYHQVAVKLDTGAFETLKRLSTENAAPYAVVISMALAAMENTVSVSPLTSQPASKQLVVYAYLPDKDRKPIRELVRQWRSSGGSFAAIAKRLYAERRIAGVDSLPLGASTIRGMCAR